METIIGWTMGLIMGFCFLMLMIKLFAEMHDHHKANEKLRKSNEEYARNFGLEDED